ncbi:MAG: hypothetical protein Q4F66_03085, partial [Clostridium sp.]|nr:hypothetical protein [Clostridium sp.]
MVIIHDEVEYKMNKLVMLSEIRKEKKKINLSGRNENINKDTSDNYNEEYLNFKNKLCRDNSIENNHSKEYIQNNHNPSISKEKLNEDINRIFLLKNKNPFLDFINEIFDDCIGTNCFIEYVSNSEQDSCITDGILKDPSNNIKIIIKDEYRSFEYNIQIQTSDCENIAITISKTDLSAKSMNVINLGQKKKQYKINTEKEKLAINNNSGMYLIMVNSNIRVPDSYEVRQECNGSEISYKFNIFKGWKYDFKDLYERNLYMLFPLKIFDLKKCITYMKDSSYSEDMIEKEVYRFFNEMNKYLSRVKEKNIINDDDINEFNTISNHLLSNSIN